MDSSREGKTDFWEAERRYAELRRRRDAGAVGPQEFDAQLNELTVRDADGRWWSKGREEGEWFFHDGSGWVRGTPPTPIPGGNTGRRQVVGARPGGSPAGLGWIIGGAVCAFLSLVLVPILFGPVGIFLGYMALRAGNRTAGLSVMAASGTCMIVGFIIGAIFASTL